MTNVTIIGGSLGAGKTTLLMNLIRGGSFSKEDGIIVMDAAGDIDYSRVASLARDSGVTLANATSACTVCDGPESAFKQLESMQGLENVVIELSGQMPLSVIVGRLASKGVSSPRTIYLVDPQNFALVQGADEVPYAHVVGLTKSNGVSSSDQLTKLYNPLAKVVKIDKDEVFALDRLFEGVQINGILSSGSEPHHHHHSNTPGEISKWSHKVHNPYHGIEKLEEILGSLAASYHRIKGYVALNAVKVFSFDGVQGEFNYSLVEDPLLGNGVILVANGSGSYFLESRVREQALELIEKPDPTPVLRRGSSKGTFEMYIERALVAEQYDDAIAAGEQYGFEQGDNTLFLSTLPHFAKGKRDLIMGGQLNRSQRVRQGMGTLYYLLDHPEVSPRVAAELKAQYKEDFESMAAGDWNEVKQASDPEENMGYINLIYEKI